MFGTMGFRMQVLTRISFKWADVLKVWDGLW